MNNSIYDDEALSLVRTKSIDRVPLKRAKSVNSLVRTPSVQRYQRRKRVNRLTRLHTPPLSLNTSSPYEISDHDFSFEDMSLSSPNSGSDSDLESLPDTEESTPTTSPLINKTTLLPFFDGEEHHFLRNPTKKLIRDQLFEAQNEIEDTRARNKQEAPLSIFEIPEILYKIIEYADIQNTVIPQETTPIRRKPLSYKHAMLIHGNEIDAKKAMDDSLKQSHNKNNKATGTLYNLLLVNKLFYKITKEVMEKKFFFSCEIKYNKYIDHIKTKLIQPDIQYIDEVRERKMTPELFVLHRLHQSKQNSLEIIDSQISFSKLNWLELYSCPKLLPSISIFDAGDKLKKFVVTGSKVLDDNFMILLSKKCQNLQVLDIRACELVSDSSIYSIGKYCRKLTSINLGRKSKGNLITDNSLSLLVRNNPQLNTIGLAGCSITDKLLWEIAFVCNYTLERLSLNNCSLITNQSIPLILHSNYLPNLSVLELRFVEQLTNFMPIIEFKRRQEFKGISLLIEVCELLCARMYEQERQMDKIISKKIFRDILEWVHDEDDDVSHHTLINSRFNTLRS